MRARVWSPAAKRALTRNGYTWAVYRKQFWLSKGRPCAYILCESVFAGDEDARAVAGWAICWRCLDKTTPTWRKGE